ncbi:hypothetical protein ACFQ9J_27675 [Streptomyces sp. NPDC056529]|uniref:hypothetical protein n=1 Tax=Streptomyces sp. NPDC056529 TaxID=3345855 RepID=UPI0036C584DE
MPEGDDPMRGAAAPTSPGAWDARSEALLGTPALTAGTVEDSPSAIVQAPGAATATSPRPHPTAPAPQGERPTEPPPAREDEPGSGNGPEHGTEPEPPPHRTAPNTAPPPSEARLATRPTVEPESAQGPSAYRPAAPRPTVEAESAQAPSASASGPRPTVEPESVQGPSAPAPVTPAPQPPAEPEPVRTPSAPPSTVTAIPAPRPRHGTADPVKVLLHRHRELCERAVDALEVAAGLEARGFTDRTAARYRHRDVFSLAEELYARVPRGREEAGAAAGARPPEPVAPWALAVLAPGAVAALAGLGLALAHGPVRTAVGAAGALGLAGALFLAVRRGPFRAPGGRTAPAARLWTLWLLAYAAGGDGLLAEVLTGGPDGTWDLTPGPLLGLALAVAPAAWCAHLFAVRARRRIADSRGLADFAAAVRPLFLGTVALQLLVLAALLVPTGAGPGALALGALLLLARLLTVHGHPGTASAALAAACAAEALALASVLSSRLPVPGFDALAVPVRALTDAWGPGAVPTLVCGAAALGLLAHATGSLARASAHAAP